MLDGVGSAAGRHHPQFGDGVVHDDGEIPIVVPAGPPLVKLYLEDLGAGTEADMNSGVGFLPAPSTVLTAAGMEALTWRQPALFRRLKGTEM